VGERDGEQGGLHRERQCGEVREHRRHRRDERQSRQREEEHLRTLPVVDEQPQRERDGERAEQREEQRDADEQVIEAGELERADRPVPERR